jgi:DNA topoisomerase-3
LPISEEDGIICRHEENGREETEMGKILVIAEKPSVARDIAKVLQAKQKGEGCLIGERYVVSWAVGHLVTLAEPEEYDEKYKKWNFSTLLLLV